MASGSGSGAPLGGSQPPCAAAGCGQFGADGVIEEHNHPGDRCRQHLCFLESLDEFTGTFFVGAPDVTTLPLLLYNASMSGNYQVSSITALILLAPSLLFMVVIHKFMRPEMMAKLGNGLQKTKKLRWEAF